MHPFTSFTAATVLFLATGGVWAGSTRSPAPLLVPRGSTLISDKYIVKMKKGYNITAGTDQVANKPDHLFSMMGGFSAKLTAKELNALREHAGVDYIEHDAAVTMFTVQENAPWGLARLSSTKTGSTSYTYDASAGAGTCAYVMDTGIDSSHPQFEGRASMVANFADRNNTDNNGHGTHVAGTIGSLTYGVAKKTTLYGVKVLDADGSGSNSGIIAGMEFVANHASTNSACPNGTVVNISIGGIRSAAVNSATQDLANAGYFIAVAAGNGDSEGVAQNARTVSPASSAYACAVGATDSKDAVASFSNFGVDVAIHAPGVNIQSTIPGNSTAVLSGTSMASPHIAGLAAYFLGLGAANATHMCDYIVQQALNGTITGLQSSTPNRLAQNGEMSAALSDESRGATSGSIGRYHTAGHGFYSLAIATILSIGLALI